MNLCCLSQRWWFCKAKVIDWNVVENTIISLIAIYFKTQLQHNKKETQSLIETFIDRTTNLFCILLERAKVILRLDYTQLLKMASCGSTQKLLSKNAIEQPWNGKKIGKETSVHFNFHWCQFFKLLAKTVLARRHGFNSHKNQFLSNQTDYKKTN